MSHPLYKDKVSEAYWTQFPASALGDSIKERNRIAVELLEKESNEVREALKIEAAEELSAAKDRHQRAKKGLPSDVPGDVDEYVFFFLQN